MTEHQILRLISKNETVAVNALIALVNSGKVRQFPFRDQLLTDLAEQAARRKHERAAGTLRGGYGILSPRQLACWRRRSFRYSKQLAGIAAERTGR